MKVRKCKVDKTTQQRYHLSNDIDLNQFSTDNDKDVNLKNLNNILDKMQICITDIGANKQVNNDYLKQDLSDFQKLAKLYLLAFVNSFYYYDECDNEYYPIEFDNDKSEFINIQYDYLFNKFKLLSYQIDKFATEYEYNAIIFNIVDDKLVQICNSILFDKNCKVGDYGVNKRKQLIALCNELLRLVKYDKCYSSKVDYYNIKTNLTYCEDELINGTFQVKQHMTEKSNLPDLFKRYAYDLSSNSTDSTD